MDSDGQGHAKAWGELSEREKVSACLLARLLARSLACLLATCLRRVAGCTLRACPSVAVQRGSLSLSLFLSARERRASKRGGGCVFARLSPGARSWLCPSLLLSRWLAVCAALFALLLSSAAASPSMPVSLSLSLSLPRTQCLFFLRTLQARL